jgi:hypothetical protein
VFVIVIVIVAADFNFHVDMMNLLLKPFKFLFVVVAPVKLNHMGHKIGCADAIQVHRVAARIRAWHIERLHATSRTKIVSSCVRAKRVERQQVHCGRRNELEIGAIRHIDVAKAFLHAHSARTICHLQATATFEIVHSECEAHKRAMA